MIKRYGIYRFDDPIPEFEVSAMSFDEAVWLAFQEMGYDVAELSDDRTVETVDFSDTDSLQNDD